MNNRTLLALVFAIAIVAIGAGIEPLPAAPVDTAAYEQLLRTDPAVTRAQATLLPAVTVVGRVPGAANGGADDSVMAGAVDRAELALRRGVKAGFRRVRLDVPFYTFGRASGTSE
jgi:hypothetical protein